MGVRSREGGLTGSIVRVRQPTQLPVAALLVLQPVLRYALITVSVRLNQQLF